MSQSYIMYSFEMTSTITNINCVFDAFNYRLIFYPKLNEVSYRKFPTIVYFLVATEKKEFRVFKQNRSFHKQF